MKIQAPKTTYSKSIYISTCCLIFFDRRGLRIEINTVDGDKELKFLRISRIKIHNYMAE
jgi:hypothetical protein